MTPETPKTFTTEPKIILYGDFWHDDTEALNYLFEGKTVYWSKNGEIVNKQQLPLGIFFVTGDIRIEPNRIIKYGSYPRENGLLII